MDEKDAKILELIKTLKSRAAIAKAIYTESKKLLDEGVDKGYSNEALYAVVSEMRDAKMQFIIYDEMIGKLTDILTD